MLIPNKFNGFYGGVRRCFGGGGGGGGGDGTGTGGGNDGVGSGPGVGDGSPDGGGNSGVGGPGVGGPGVGGDAGGGNTVYTPPGNVVNTGVNLTGGNTAGTSTIPSNNLNLRNMAGMPYNQVGQQYNALLQQGFTGNDIRNALTTNGKPVSDSDYGFLVQDAGMKSPTGRPMAGSDQFFQPVYNSSYMNYARPTTQFDTSTYGTQPVYSPARAWNDVNAGSAAGGKQAVSNAVNNYFQQNPNSDINSTLAGMRSVGINRTDIQAAGGYNNYGPQTSAPSMQTQMQQQFNPYSNNSGFNGQLMTAGYGGFGSPMGGLSPFVTNPMYQMPQPYNPFSSQQSSYRPQMQTPFSFQQPSYQPSYQQQSYQPSYQQQSYQQPQQYNPYQQYEQSLGSYNPYQMQSPFSYQQPSSGGYDTYGDDFGGGVNMRTPVTQQPTQPVAPRSSGPTTPIVGRSSGFRGTPNVMRRAEGGIASLMDDVE